MLQMSAGRRFDKGNKVNKIANDILRDVVHRLCQDVLYCKNVKFYGARVHVI